MVSKEQALTHLTKGFERLKIELPTQDVLELSWHYFTELIKWSAKINLVAKGPELELLENHFLDSYTMVPVLQKLLKENSTQTLLDVGSGAGFPGLVLKIACPDLPVTLVEPRQKRTVFLRHIARTLKLKNITILEERINNNDSNFSKKHGQFSLITCRALTQIKEFLEMTQNVATPGAKILLMKGPKAKKELKACQADLDNFNLDSLSSFTLPFSGAVRSLVIFTRTSDTQPTK